MKLMLAALFFVACVVVVARAQSAQQPTFDVVSIRPHDPKVSGSMIRIPPQGEITISGVNLRTLITFAYDVREYQVSGLAKWATSDKYDIRAKGPAEATNAGGSRPTMDQQRARIQALLADSFGLKLHHESRQSQVYFLTVAKTGLKMPPASGRDPYSPDKGTILPWAFVVSELSTWAGAPIIDKTGITGAYYLKLHYSTIDGHAAGIPADQLDGSNPGPFLTTAVQEQLGLRLDAGKGPIDTLVIDSVSKPAEN
jgi:uncharacterized protein (TIGR03435 family)